ARTQLVVGRVREQPGRIGPTDRLHDEYELRLGKRRNHLLGMWDQIEQIAAASHRRRADERDLLLDRERTERRGGGRAVSARERGDVARRIREVRAGEHGST